MTGDVIFIKASVDHNLSVSTLPISRSVPPGHVHVGAAEGIIPTLVEFGVEPGTIIRRAGLEPSLFEDGLNVIELTALGRLLSLCVAFTNCPHFGLLVGSRATIQALGFVGRRMQFSETVRDALDTYVSSLSIEDRGAVPWLQVHGDIALLSHSIYQSRVESVHQITDLAIALAVNALRTLCGPDWRPIEILLPRPIPTNCTPYRRFFKAEIHFNQEDAAIVFPATDLKRQIVGADPLLCDMLDYQIGLLKGNPGTEFADDLRRLLRTRMTSMHCSAGAVSGLLNMHRRTLNRRLKENGTSHRALTNELRFEMARQLLEGTDVPLAEIAVALGYSEASAFTRAFRRWSGCAPTIWRDTQRPLRLSPKIGSVPPSAVSVASV